MSLKLHAHSARLKADYRPQGMQFASIKLEACPASWLRLFRMLRAAVAAAVGQFVIPVPGTGLPLNAVHLVQPGVDLLTASAFASAAVHC